MRHLPWVKAPFLRICSIAYVRCEPAGLPKPHEPACNDYSNKAQRAKSQQATGTFFYNSEPLQKLIGKTNPDSSTAMDDFIAVIESRAVRKIAIYVAESSNQFLRIEPQPLEDLIDDVQIPQQSPKKTTPAHRRGLG